MIKKKRDWLGGITGKAQKILTDDGYIELRKQRSAEVETVFGQIKGNQGTGF
jgi:hypothetical protein